MGRSFDNNSGNDKSAKMSKTTSQDIDNLKKQLSELTPEKIKEISKKISGEQLDRLIEKYEVESLLEEQFPEFNKYKELRTKVKIIDFGNDIVSKFKKDRSNPDRYIKIKCEYKGKGLYVLNTGAYTLEFKYQHSVRQEDTPEDIAKNRSTFESFLMMRVTGELLAEAEKLEKEKNKLERKVTKLTTKKGIVKKPMSMIKAERYTMIDLQEANGLFGQHLDINDMQKIKEDYTSKSLIHLKTNYVYIYEALLYYIQLYRNSKKYPEYKNKNIRNGGKIVALTREIDDDEATSTSYERRLRIQDSWVSFCEKAGITDPDQRKNIAKELDQKGEIIASAVASNTEDQEIDLHRKFISYKFRLANKKNNNFKNNVDNKVKADIVMHVEIPLIESILGDSITGHAGWATYPHPLQKILQNVFADSNKKLQLKQFCEEQEIKSTGERYSIGYHHIYTEIHADMHFKNTENFKYKGKGCYLLVLNNTEIKKYATKAYPKAFRSNKFYKKEAINFILKSLKVIQLACDDENKDLIKIIHFEYIAPAIHIYINKMKQQDTLNLEKINLSLY